MEETQKVLNSDDTGSVMKTDLARITLMLTGDTSIADQYLLKRDKFKLKEFSTALAEYAFRKAFPDAGNLLEKAGRLQAQAERSELQNAFLEKMLQLTETKGQLKSALADANAQNELSKLKEKNRGLEEALKGKDAEIAEAVKRLQTAEAKVCDLKEKCFTRKKRKKSARTAKAGCARYWRMSRAAWQLLWTMSGRQAAGWRT